MKRSMYDKLKDILADGRWYKPYDLCSIYQNRHGRLYSESTMTAKLRALRKPEHGACNIVSRPPSGKANGGAWEYSWKKEEGGNDEAQRDRREQKSTGKKTVNQEKHGAEKRSEKKTEPKEEPRYQQGVIAW